jgi:hypothetical protein
MTTQLTPEQVQEWAREADLGGLQLNGEDWAIPLGTQRFTELARADLVEEVKVLDTRDLARAEDLVAENYALRTEVEVLRKDAARYQWLCDNNKSFSWTPSRFSPGLISGFSFNGTGYLGFNFADAVTKAMEETK